MKVSIKWVLASIFLLTGLLVIYLFMHPLPDSNPGAETKPDTRADVSGPEIPVQATAGLPGPADKMADAPVQTPEKERPGSAIQWMQESRDYRAVIERLAQAGTAQAGLYADMILKQCYMVMRSGVQAVGTASTRQDQAKELLWARCASFSSDELSGDSMRRLSQDPRFPPGLMALRNEWSAVAGDAVRRQEVLGRIFEQRDPLLLEQVGLGLIVSSGGAIDVGEKRFSGEQALAAVRSGWIAAVCEGTGSQCGAHDYYAVDMCANTGICENSRREAFRAVTAVNQGEEALKDFDAAYGIFVNAIRSGNAAIFAGKGHP